MFDFKPIVVLCLLLALGGCDTTRGGTGRLHKGATVAANSNDFNNYVNAVTENTNAPHWAGKQQAAVEIRELQRSGKIFTLSRDTKAEYVQSDDVFICVRILEGEHRGEEVWTEDDSEFKLKNQFRQQTP